MNTIQAAKAALLESDDLTTTERLVLTIIALHANPRTGDAYPSVATIARYAHCSERTVQRALAKLVKLGRLVVAKVKGIVTRVYRVVVEGVTSAAEKVTSGAAGVTSGVAELGDTQTSPEEVEDPEEKKTHVRAGGRLDWRRYVPGKRGTNPTPQQRPTYERRGAALPPPSGGDRCQRPGHDGQPAGRCIPCRSEILAGGVL